MMADKIFTVTQGSDSQTLKCIDANTGMIYNTYRFVGTVASGPVVTGDRVTIILRRGNTYHGEVLKLPSFMLTSTFQT